MTLSIFDICSLMCVFFLNWFLQIKRLIGSDNKTLTILERFVAGSLAGVIAQSTIYPMEVIYQFNWIYSKNKKALDYCIEVSSRLLQLNETDIFFA